MELSKRGDVYVLNLGSTENRFDLPTVQALSDHLREVESSQAPCALVVTASGKFFSNGIDLQWLSEHPDAFAAYLPALLEVFAQLVESGVPSVAAINGHCFAAGAMLALAHDFRIMREDRGYFCLPEVDINIPFVPGMNALIRARIPQPAQHEAMAFGRRYTGPEAMAAGIVESVAAESDLLEQAIARAQGLVGKNQQTLSTIKQNLYAEVLTALRGPQA